MPFTSPTFLFIFLPIVLVGGLLLRKTAGNVFLLIASLFFYAWGQGSMVLVLVSSILLNYLTGLGLMRWPKQAGLLLWIGIGLNVLLLLMFKYADAFFSFSDAKDPNGDQPWLAAIGISFFTFQGIAYLIDVARNANPAEKNPLRFALFISFFPQILSGPINRYNDLSAALRQRSISAEGIAEGSLRFIRGLAKKVIIANALGAIADQIFGTPARELPTSVAWIGIACYTLQLFFDFSGYTDMAIGIARIFGFRFRENFNFPYIAKSIQEFWQRWHMSLSSWLRDYLFAPISVTLRHWKGAAALVAVLITFLICGIWHGPGWQFVIWGLIHALLLVFENLKFVRFKRIPAFLRHIYTLLAVMVGWVFFRSEDIPYALSFLKRLFGLASGNNYASLIYINNYTVFIFILAVVLCLPTGKTISKLLKPQTLALMKQIWHYGRYPVYLFLLFIEGSELAQSAYNPFIYFRF
jgi:alginate O-acetyltransferase complex protein AlgI